jgi:arsenite methyltransferase
VKANEQPDYGIDAPSLVVTFFAVAAVGLFLALSGVSHLWPARGLDIAAFIIGMVLMLYGDFMGVSMIYRSKVTKVREREPILSLIPWTGSERVLDVGCRRGLMLVGAARRLTQGLATGVDSWVAKDQSRNRPEAPLENARKEGVLPRVSVVTGDARSLPFASSTFDVVLSHWVVHNIGSETERTKALSEMMRVLANGGKLILTDIALAPAYAETLRALGAQVVTVHPPAPGARLLGTLSFGSFLPQTVVATK